MRIAHFLAKCGLGSRRDCEKFIESRLVMVNNNLVAEYGLQVSEQDVVKYKGKVVSCITPRMFLYHKMPEIIVTAKDDRFTVFDDLQEIGCRLISVGRLDFLSEGLMIMTNDGAIAREWEMSNSIRRYSVRTCMPDYEANIARGIVDRTLPINDQYNGAQIQKEHAIGRRPQVSIVNGGGVSSNVFSHPWNRQINLDGVLYKPITLVDIIKIENGVFDIVVDLTEGKNREIRNIWAHYGWKIQRLMRIGYGPFMINMLRGAKWIEIDVKFPADSKCK